MSNKPTDATGHDNRGTDELPFGCVYFADGKRIGYTSNTGVVDGTDNWGPVTSQHIESATAYLRERNLINV